MTLEAVRQFALSLPGTTEEPHFEKSSFRVKGRLFATVPEDGQHLHVFVDEEEARAAVADDGDAYEELRWGARVAGVRVVLAAASSDRVVELLEDAWRRRAPKRIVADYDG